jgi:hypothetical protein
MDTGEVGRSEQLGAKTHNKRFEADAQKQRAAQAIRYATQGSSALIERIVMVLLLSCSTLTWAQDPIGQRQWNDGVYKEHPFSYPETLSKAEINGIMLSIKSLSTHEVFVISLQPKDNVTVKTCTHGIRKPMMCDAGEIFVYQKIQNSWVEIPEQRSRWLQ